MKLDDLIGKVERQYHSQQPDNYLRYGQILMNALSEFDPDMYKRITGTEYDCFYDNGKVDLLLDKLRVEWATPQNSKSIQKRLEALQRLSDLDQELGFY